MATVEVIRGKRYVALIEVGNSLTIYGAATVRRWRSQRRMQSVYQDSQSITTTGTAGPWDQEIYVEVEPTTTAGCTVVEVFSAGGSWSTAPGMSSPIAAQLPTWRKALARVRAGTGRGRLLLMGDSTTAGLGSGTSGTTNSVGAFANSRTAALTARLNALGIPASNNSFMGDQGVITLPTAYGSYDSRVTLGANHSHPTGGSTSTLAGQMFLYTNGAVNNMTFTPVSQVDTVKVFNARAGSNGSFAVNVDGGASLGTVTTNGGNAIIENTFTFTKGAHTINFVPSNNGNYYTIGALAYDSTTPAIDVIQAGWSGALITSMNIATSAWHPALMHSFLLPDLTILQMTINDGNAATPVATYTASVQAIIDRVKAFGGDIVLESGIPSGTTNGQNGIQATLMAAVRSIAEDNKVPFIDIGGRFVNYSYANTTLGWMFDTLHGNALGYQDEGRFEGTILASV